MYNDKVEAKIEDRLLATHIANNPEFTTACTIGDASKIIAIVATEMEKNNLYTKGSKKLQADILRMLQGQSSIPKHVGQRVLMFVWNSRLAGKHQNVLTDIRGYPLLTLKQVKNISTELFRTFSMEIILFHLSINYRHDTSAVT